MRRCAQLRRIEQQMRIVRCIAQAFTQRGERGGHLAADPVANRRRRSASNRPDVRRRSAAASACPATRWPICRTLPALKRMKSDCFRRQRTQRDFATCKQRLDVIGEQREMTMPVDRRRAFATTAVAHHAPPNTSISLNTQAGDAWPTRTICAGSPLPHIGVPIHAACFRVADRDSGCARNSPRYRDNSAA